MKTNKLFASLVFVRLLAVGAPLAYAMDRVGANTVAFGIGVSTCIVALAVSVPIQVAAQWDRVVVLRLGHFHSLRGPGLLFIIPVIDTIPYWINTRVITTGFKAEKTLTKDPVPVDVDAISNEHNPVAIHFRAMQEGMATFCKLFTKATLQYFEHGSEADARKWLGEASPR